MPEPEKNGGTPSSLEQITASLSQLPKNAKEFTDDKVREATRLFEKGREQVTNASRESRARFLEEMTEWRKIAKDPEMNAAFRNELEVQVGLTINKNTDPLIKEGQNFIEELGKRDFGGKMQLIVEKIGELAERAWDVLGSIGTSGLLAAASALEMMGMDATLLRRFAGQEGVIIRSVLKEKGLVLTKDIAVNGSRYDKEALGKLRQRYDRACAARLQKEQAAAPAQPVQPGQPAPAPTVTMDSVKALYSFETFFSEAMATIAKDWSKNEHDIEGRPKVTLREIEAALPQ
jgi:hypothetical protein